MILKPYIREKRMEAHLNQNQLAEKLNISNAYMSNIESGKRYPDALLIWQIAKECKCKVDDLYEEIS